MHFQKKVSLQPFNSFNIAVSAEDYALINSVGELKEALNLIKKEGKSPFILNGGSNLLFTKDVEESVIHINLKGKQLVSENDDEVIIEVQAGENWNDFVQYCIENDWGGLENLSLIPGNSGTSPMQNIGAYGVEIKDVFHSLSALNINTLEIQEFNSEDCKFGYRESYFKQEGKNQFIILSVQFKLTKPPHKINSDYGAIQEVLKNKNIENPTIKDISNTVIEIRKSKLPDPKEIGNAGSFFKNPVIEKSKYEALLKKYPEMPSYPVNDKDVKVPAGWLIDKAGWRGKRFGNYGVYDKQALILVNYGGATGKEIWQLSEDIIQDIQSKFGIELIREVNIY